MAGIRRDCRDDRILSFARQTDNRPILLEERRFYQASFLETFINVPASPNAPENARKKARNLRIPG